MKSRVQEVAEAKLRKEGVQLNPQLLGVLQLVQWGLDHPEEVSLRPAFRGPFEVALAELSRWSLAEQEEWLRSGDPETEPVDADMLEELEMDEAAVLCGEQMRLVMAEAGMLDGIF